ncbi:MAG: radical SAM protein, partial [Acutalibacteraceae bacterium]|nr:radical SAM protein [Acutalibacteraceae bacterium]
QNITEYADEVCLLFGLTGQTEESMLNDIETGLKYFDRVCVNIMTPNTTKVKPDTAVISVFKNKVAKKYINNSRVDILFENTDFGVGS